MRMQYFGDSYDIVKRFLVHTIAPDGDWAALPMFSGQVPADEVTRYEAFLGVRVIQSGLVPQGSDCRPYFAASPEERRLLLDSNTGIRVEPLTGAKARDFIFVEEIAALCRSVPSRLVVVFDQSHPRGAERESLRRKLGAFQSQSFHGFAYCSHAAFVVLSSTESVSIAAQDRLTASWLPIARIVVVQP